MIELVRRLGGARVVVVGDLIADEYVYGRVARVSREAPVLILEYDSTEIVPGGAGNAANNVAALGGQVTLVSLIGRDEPGRRAERALLRRVDRGSLVRPAGFLTPVKTRILAGGIHSAKQQVVRIDRLSPRPITNEQRTAVARAAHKALGKADAVLISDYGSGLVTPALARDIRGRLGGRSVPVLVDSRYALTRYRGLTACAPNESEVEQALGLRIGDNLRVLERAGRQMLARTRMQAVVVTRGSRGMAVFENGKKTVHIPIFGSDQVTDVTGAGDTVMAALTLALAAGASLEQAAQLANVAGGLVVMKRGTATVSGPELRKVLGSG
ncbi:MAG TPA: PfkB family carbohydrate kinase [Vicinamibacterales bacterium]|jgi:rfaE bifunctional protein kinase chain/domain|nr:PfkB family carbohydrate kinase [Vicinamibacterales bacterium]